MTWKTPEILLPVSFFGFAALANVSAVQNGELTINSVADFMKGGVTAQIDDMYRENLPMREYATGALGAARFVLLNDGRKGVMVGNDGWLFSSEEVRSHTPDSVPAAETVGRMAEIIAEFQDMGTRVVVVPLPAKIDIAREEAGVYELSDRRNAEYQEFLTLLTNADIPHVDTYAVFAELGPQAFYRTDTHWNTSATVAVADLVAASGMIAAGSDAFEVETQPQEEFIGDLVNFVTNELFADAAGFGMETVEPFVAIGGGAIDLFGNASEPSTMLIGTSYSANPRWSFVEALKLSLQRDILNLASEGQGPVVPMLDFVAEMETAPELIIWEFPIRYLTDPELWGDWAADNAQLASVQQ